MALARPRDYTRLAAPAFPAAAQAAAVRHGTTTLAFIAQDGIVVAVDSKATAGTYVASTTVNKVIEINQYLLGTMAGGAADCFHWERALGVYARRYELETGTRLSPEQASMFLTAVVGRYSGRGLSMSTMLCGFGPDGPRIFNVTDAGARVEHHIFSVGSGSTVAKGILAQHYRPDMPRDEALAVAKDAIFAAGTRDAGSGGSINLYFMTAAGWEKVGSYGITETRDEKEVARGRTA